MINSAPCVQYFEKIAHCFSSFNILLHMSRPPPSATSSSHTNNPDSQIDIPFHSFSSSSFPLLSRENPLQTQLQSLLFVNIFLHEKTYFFAKLKARGAVCCHFLLLNAALAVVLQLGSAQPTPGRARGSARLPSAAPKPRGARD